MAAATVAQPKGREPGLKTRLAAAVSHEVRTLCFAILGERVASPIEIARELRIDKGVVGYHVRALLKWELIELVEERPVRGAIEHFYRAVEFSELTDEEEATLGSDERRRFAETILSLFAADAVRALDQELLYKRIDHFFVRHVYDIDEEGWAQTVEAYRTCFERVKEIKVAADERLAIRKSRLDEQTETERSRSEEKDPLLRIMSFLALHEVPPLNR